MDKVVIWGTAIAYAEYVQMMNHYVTIGDFAIAGIIIEESYASFSTEYPSLTIKDLEDIQFDYLLICANEQFGAIRQKANILGIPEYKILSAVALKVPNFRLKKYIELKNSNLSIIANNCWGGITYHYLGLEFRSPFINMYTSEPEYLNMVKNLKTNLEMPLELYGTQYNDFLKIIYPIYNLNGTKLFMNHYSDFALAEEKWQKRKAKINYDNLFVMMSTSDPKVAEEFETLPYAKKVCFVPFETDLPSSYYLSADCDEPFWRLVLNCAFGGYKCYDVLDMLLLGEVHSIHG